MLLSHLVCAVLNLSPLPFGTIVGPSDQVTYAERLGWPKGTRVVIFHVDDAGMSYDSNMGVIQALEGGVATSTSVMMPCPWVPQIAAYLKGHPQVDAGLHLTLNAEWKDYRWGPVAGKPAVPGLVDESGCLWRRVADVCAHATVEEVEREIRAQVDKALAMGLTPTHLDSHMGTCLYEPFIEAYVKVGMEKKIPLLMVGGHMQYAGAEVGQLKMLIHALAERVWKAGLPVIDDLVTQPTQGPQYERRKQELLQLLANMRPGITQIIVHCTAVTEVFSHISSSGEARAAELHLMLDPDVRSFLRKQGFVLTTWRELQRRRDAVKQ
jgi:predicted glycoside hydrolase/deacetylase ChbG (UPF0249 family)